MQTPPRSTEPREAPGAPLRPVRRESDELGRAGRSLFATMVGAGAGAEPCATYVETGTSSMSALGEERRRTDTGGGASSEDTLVARLHETEARERTLTGPQDPLITWQGGMMYRREQRLAGEGGESSEEIMDAVHPSLPSRMAPRLSWRGHLLFQRQQQMQREAEEHSIPVPSAPLMTE